MSPAGSPGGIIGNPVRVRSGPAAVTGNENRRMPLERYLLWEGAVIRVIREPEDRPAGQWSPTIEESWRDRADCGQKREVPGPVMVRFFFGGNLMCRDN